MNAFIYIVFGCSAALILIWMVQTSFKTAKRNTQMRQEIYNKEVEERLEAESQEIDEK